MKNLFLEALNIAECKKAIARKTTDECIILIPHYSINIQSKYYNEPTPDYLIEKGCDLSEQMQWDYEDCEKALGTNMYVNDYDDLCCDGSMEVETNNE